MSRRIVATGMATATTLAAAESDVQLFVLPIAALTVEAVTGPVGGQQADDVIIVLGPLVADPAAVIYRLRPGTSHVGVVVIGPRPVAGRDALTLMTGDYVRRVEEGRPDELRQLLDVLFGALATRRRHRVMQAGVQAQLIASSTRIEQQLGERFFGEMLSRAPIGAVLTDTAARLLAWNTRAAALLELRDPGSLHIELSALFDDPATVAAHLAASGPHTDDDGAGPATFDRTSSDGTAGHLRVTCQPSMDDTGRTRLLILIEDVTELVNTQRELTLRSQAAMATAQVAAALTTAEPIDRKLHRCAEAITTHLGLAAAAIWTTGEDILTPVLQAVTGSEADTLRHQPLEAIRAVAAGGSVATSRGIIGAAEAGLRGLRTAAAARTPEVLSYPLISEDQPVGALTVRCPAPADPAVLAPLPAIARQIAVGIRQDLLYQRVRSVAEALQRPLLPPTLPTIPDMDLAVRYRPYGDGTRIGGDFYDAFELSDGRFVLALGDIRGKGPEAAAATGLVRHTIWTAAQHSTDPEYVLGLVNRALLRLGDARFCTLVYGLLTADPDGSFRLQLTCAGHPPPVIARDGSARLARSRGTLLGATPRLRLHSETIALTAGTAVVCYTDGFTEGGGVFLREPEDIAAEVGALANDTLSAAVIADALLTRAISNPAGQVRDDLALLVAVSP